MGLRSTLPAASLVALTGMSSAQPAPTSLWERDRLTGDWGGLRSDLESQGLTLGGEYIAEFTSVIDGGIDANDSIRNLFTLDAELDLETAFGVKGGTFFAQYLSVNAERGGSRDAGDLQVFSNIENDRSLDVLYELWYEQLFLGDRVRVKIGKIDANSEFAFVEAAGEFANSSAGFSPAIFVFPSYPDPATSVNLFATLIRQDAFEWTIGYGLYDGAAGVDGVPTGTRGPSTFFDSDRSNDYFHIAQTDFKWDARARLTLGAWRHTGDFARFDGGVEDETTGFFATGELRVFAPDAARDEASEHGIYLFGQYAWADEDVSEVAQHFGAGAVWRGMFASRPDDSAGLYVSFADLSDDAGFEDDELALDAYYRFQLAPAVFVQPEAQHILRPSGDPGIGDALIFGLRVGVSF